MTRSPFCSLCADPRCGGRGCHQRQPTAAQASVISSSQISSHTIRQFHSISAGGKAAQFIIDQRQQLSRGFRVALVNPIQDAGHIARAYD